jgi:hypothetical protein
MNNVYTILVNSSDGFEDCWGPFFFLFEKYWPDCHAQILLNTERKNWKHPRLNVRSTTVQDFINTEKRLTWSQCLLAALDQIETPLVLYFQEDYFIHKKVRSEVVQQSAKYMIEHPEVKHIGLTKHGSVGPYHPFSVNWLEEIPQRARYRISTQAGLWRVETLRSYLRPEENGWMFEIYGTWRAYRRKEYFLCAAFDDQRGGPTIDYLHTGIIKGKWLKDIQCVFKSNGIEVDYSQRGFYVPKHPLIQKVEVLKKLLQRPGYFLKQIISICSARR